MRSDSESWFVIQVTSRHEVHVDLMLRHKGYERFLPTYQVKRQWSDRIKTIEQPLFPGYLFCRSSRSCLGTILNTPGILRIISFGGRPYAVPDREIEDLQRAIQSGRHVCSVPYLTRGQKVKITAGPLAGIVGIITRVKNQDRLVLAVESIMRAVGVEVAVGDVAIVGSMPPRTATHTGILNDPRDGASHRLQ